MCKNIEHHVYKIYEVWAYKPFNSVINYGSGRSGRVGSTPTPHFIYLLL